MKPQSKAILRKSLYEFKKADEYKQAEMINLVKLRLEQYRNSLKTIGYGYADNFVEAGKVFLRIVKI